MRRSLFLLKFWAREAFFSFIRLLGGLEGFGVGERQQGDAPCAFRSSFADCWPGGSACDFLFSFLHPRGQVVQRFLHLVDQDQAEVTG